MRLSWSREREHEATIRAMYELNGQTDGIPEVHYGRDAKGVDVLHALMSREEWEPGDTRWHISFSAEGRVPTWDEIAAGIHALRPGVPMVLGVPPRSWWMNIHPHVLHAWETKDWALINQWRANRKGHAPS